MLNADNHNVTLKDVYVTCKCELFVNIFLVCWVSFFCNMNARAVEIKCLSYASQSIVFVNMTIQTDKQLRWYIVRPSLQEFAWFKSSYFFINPCEIRIIWNKLNLYLCVCVCVMKMDNALTPVLYILFSCIQHHQIKQITQNKQITDAIYKERLKIYKKEFKYTIYN